jgi:hypothetical protein
MEMWNAAFSKGFDYYDKDTLLILRILDASAIIKNCSALPAHPAEAESTPQQPVVTATQQQTITEVMGQNQEQVPASLLLPAYYESDSSSASDSSTIYTNVQQLGSLILRFLSK